MIANNILLDAFTRVHESLHRTLGDITPEELVKEPHPSIGWLAWRISIEGLKRLEPSRLSTI